VKSMVSKRLLGTGGWEGAFGGIGKGSTFFEVGTVWLVWMTVKPVLVG
jgi:hypothetical protein